LLIFVTDTMVLGLMNLTPLALKTAVFCKLMHNKSHWVAQNFNFAQGFWFSFWICTPIWSPHTVCNVSKIEPYQRWFTKRIKVVYGLDYSQQLIFLGLETLEVRRIKYDLIMCYKILNGEVSLTCNLFD